MNDKRNSVQRKMTAREQGDSITTDVGSAAETPFEPATILATACPALGQEKQWEQALSELMRASHLFPGHLGTTVLKPTADGDSKYRIITKFDSTQHMENWRDSDERQRRVERISRFQSKPADIHFVTGLETWFELPHQEGAMLPPPPKYKMAILIWIAVYCTVLPLIAVLKPVFSSLPALLSSAILAIASVVLMTWVVMPLLTVLFRSWLYPKPNQIIGTVTEQQSEKETQDVERL